MEKVINKPVGNARIEIIEVRDERTYRLDFPHGASVYEIISVIDDWRSSFQLLADEEATKGETVPDDSSTKNQAEV